MAKRTTIPNASGAITASGASAAAPLPNDGGIVEALINVTAVSGTSPSLTPKIQVSMDGSTWFDAATGNAMTAVSTQRLQVMTMASYARVSYTVSGTTPSLTTAITFLAS